MRGGWPLEEEGGRRQGPPGLGGVKLGGLGAAAGAAWLPGLPAGPAASGHWSCPPMPAGRPPGRPGPPAPPSPEAERRCNQVQNSCKTFTCKPSANHLQTNCKTRKRPAKRAYLQRFLQVGIAVCRLFAVNFCSLGGGCHFPNEREREKRKGNGNRRRGVWVGTWGSGFGADIAPLHR